MDLQNFFGCCATFPGDCGPSIEVFLFDTGLLLFNFRFCFCVSESDCDICGRSDDFCSLSEIRLSDILSCFLCSIFIFCFCVSESVCVICGRSDGFCSLSEIRFCQGYRVEIFLYQNLMVLFEKVRIVYVVLFVDYQNHLVSF